MKFAGKFAAIVCSVLALAACDSETNLRLNEEPAPTPPSSAKLQVFHGIPEAPAVNVLVDGTEIITGLDYQAASNIRSIIPGRYSVEVVAQLPGGDTSVFGPADLTFDASTITKISAVGPLSIPLDVSVEVISDGLPAAGNARVFVLHATSGATIVDPDPSLPVDVYVDPYSEPNVPIGTSAPFTFDFKETLGPLELPAGDYQVRVTLSGDLDPVYDSGRVTLSDGADLTLAAVPNTSGGPAAVTLMALGDSGAGPLLDVNTPTSLQIVHTSPDAPNVDIVVNGDVLVPNLPFPAATGFVEVPAGTYNVQVTAAGNPGVVAIGPVDLTLDAGVRHSVLAVDFLGNIDALILTDDPRRVATAAKVRIVHASPTAQDVDVYVNPPETDINDVDPTIPGFAFRDNTGYLELAEGDYQVTVTLAGTKTAAIGPAVISVDAGGIYTAIARDPLPETAEFGLILADDFAD